MLHLLVNALEVHRVQAHREHHDLHHAEGCNQQALERGALLGHFRPRRAFGRHRLRLVAQVCERGKVRGERRAVGRKAEAQAVRNRVDLGGFDAGLFPECCLDQPAAGRTVHAAYIDCRLAHTIVLLRECIEHVRTVENLPFGGFIRWATDPGIGRIAKIVIAGHPRIENKFRDSLAARATYGALRALDFYGETAASRDGQCAVEAGVRGCHRCRCRLA